MGQGLLRSVITGSPLYQAHGLVWQRAGGGRVLQPSAGAAVSFVAYDDGSAYIGETDDKYIPHGWGIFHKATSDIRFEGQFNHGKITERGCLTIRPSARQRSLMKTKTPVAFAPLSKAKSSVFSSGCTSFPQKIARNTASETGSRLLMPFGHRLRLSNMVRMHGDSAMLGTGASEPDLVGAYDRGRCFCGDCDDEADSVTSAKKWTAPSSRTQNGRQYKPSNSTSLSHYTAAVDSNRKKTQFLDTLWSSPETAQSSLCLCNEYDKDSTNPHFPSDYLLAAQKEWFHIPFEELRFAGRLGPRTFAGSWLGTKVAISVISGIVVRPESWQQYVDTLRSLRHPAICCVLGVAEVSDDIRCIVKDWADGGSVGSWLAEKDEATDDIRSSSSQSTNHEGLMAARHRAKQQQARQEALLRRYNVRGDIFSSASKIASWKPPRNLLEVLELFRGIATAVEFLHSKNVHHGTLRASNVLFTSTHEVRLTGFCSWLLADALRDVDAVPSPLFRRLSTGANRNTPIRCRLQAGFSDPTGHRRTRKRRYDPMVRMLYNAPACGVPNDDSKASDNSDGGGERQRSRELSIHSDLEDVCTLSGTAEYILDEECNDIVGPEEALPPHTQSEVIDEDVIDVNVIDDDVCSTASGSAATDDAVDVPCVTTVGCHDRWAAPETFQNEKPQGSSPAADVYAMGIIMWSVLVGKPPLCELSLPQMALLLGHGKFRLRPPKGLPSQLHDLLTTMLDPFPDRRPSATNVLRDLTLAKEYLPIQVEQAVEKFFSRAEDDTAAALTSGPT